MSSLWQLFKKPDRSQMPESMKDAWKLLPVSDPKQWHKVILVNAQSVYADVAVEGRVADLYEIASECPRIIPPFPSMWFEFIGWNDLRHAVFCQRLTEENGESMDFFLASVRETQGGMSIFGEVTTIGRIPRGGSGADATWTASDEVGEAIMQQKEWALTGLWSLFTALHSISRMNCCNVELRPIKMGKSTPQHQFKVIPATVWHEIKITSVPKIHSTGSSVFRRDESKMRAFWVRGHYADYSKGAGLFGNPNLRGVFWIPEHRRGNEQLGQIIPEYKID